MYRLARHGLRRLHVPTVQNGPETVTIVPTVHALCAPQPHHKLVPHLLARNLVESVTSEALYALPEEKKLKVYCGADPTARLLHLGNLLPLMVLLHFVLKGHDVVALVGGATSQVGDPSGRTTERTPMEEQIRESNAKLIRLQMVTFLENGVKYAESRNIDVSKAGKITGLNNFSWWKDVGFLPFLAKYGKHIRVSQMLARESVLARLQGGGLGFNEFAYQVLQAYDFWHLFKEHNVSVQLGGNDQWGNITAGVDLILRLQSGAEAFGMTVPLLTAPSGEKFGKSAGNAVFVSSELTTPFQLYQYFVNTADDMAGTLLKSFTLVPLASIDGLMEAHAKDPAFRIPQRVLAREVTDLVHGPGTGDRMAYVTSFLFPTPDQPFEDDITADLLEEKLAGSGILGEVSLSQFPEGEDVKMSTLLSVVLDKSKRETKQLIKSGGIYLGISRKQLIDDDDVVLFDRANHLFDGRLLMVRVGKQNYKIVSVTG